MIDKNPEVGRWVVLESVLRNGVFGDCGKITKISGARIYYISSRGESTFCHKFSAICDTQEEATSLRKKTEQACEDIYEFRKMKRREQIEFAFGVSVPEGLASIVSDNPQGD